MTRSAGRRPRRRRCRDRVTNGEIRLGALVRFPKRLIPEHRLIQAKNDLVLKPQGPDKYGFGKAESPVVVLWRDDGEYVEVPRQYAVEHLWDLVDQYGFVDETVEGAPVDFRWVGDAEHLRRSTEKGQPDWARRQNEWVEKLHGGLLASRVRGVVGEAPTSFGKTSSTCKLISILGRTTLVIVHKDFLLRQWADRAKEWLGLTDEEIGFVQGPKCQFEGKKLVIAMVESLVQREYPPEFYRWPGVVALDELHRMCAVTWSKAAPKFPARWRIGISATARRRDGLDKVFKWTIGPVSVREREWYLKATVYQIAWPVWIEPRKYSVIRKNEVTGEEEVEKTFLGKLMNLLVALPKYNDWLLAELLKAVEKGRTVLLLSERRAHLQQLKEGFDRLSAGKYKTGYYWGSQGKKAQAQASDCAVLFGTAGKAKEGLDLPGLDTLFLTCPRADVEQDVGRCLRLDPDKKSPLVLDVVHVGIPVAEEFAEKRKKMYLRKGFDVKRVGKWPAEKVGASS